MHDHLIYGILSTAGSNGVWIKVKLRWH